MLVAYNAICALNVFSTYEVTKEIDENNIILRS